MHNASQALMGATGSNVKEVSSHKGTVEAGLAVRQKDDGTLSTATGSGVGGFLGISLGKDLSDIGFTAIARKGLRIPVKLKAGVDPVPGDPVYIEDATGLAMKTSSSSTLVNAVFASGRLGGTTATGGIAEGATDETGSVGVAYIDMPGGL